MVNYSLNLAALFHFYENDDILYNLTSKSSFANPVIPESPKIEIITKEFKLVVQKESKVKLSLKHIVSNLKRKQRMYSDTTSVVYVGLTFGPILGLTFGPLLKLAFSCTTSKMAQRLTQPLTKKCYQKPVKLALRLQELFFIRQ